MTPRSAGKIAIVLFCLFHMAAVAAYAAPDYTPEPLLSLKEDIVEISRPYILMTSQWQKWNLFSPDPLRRIVSFHIDKELKDGSWEEIKIVGPGNVEWWHRATELKVIRRMEESEGGGNLQALRERYVLEQCKDLPDGTKLRLRRLYYVIPRHEVPPPVEEWHAYTPEVIQDFDVLVICPST